MSGSGKETRAVILAAGKGTRMKSDLPKVLHPLAGKPLVLHVLENLRRAGIERPVVIIGHEGEQVRSRVEADFPHPVDFVWQTEQLGTGHAVKMAGPKLADFDGQTLILSGDVPLLGWRTMEKLVSAHNQAGSVLTLMSMLPPDPARYGRVIRDERGKLKAIIEYKDADEATRAVREVNAGTYLVDNRELFPALEKINNQNAAGEYYLPDIAGIFLAEKKPMGVFRLEDPVEASGVNTPEELAALEKIWMKNRQSGA